MFILRKTQTSIKQNMNYLFFSCYSKNQEMKVFPIIQLFEYE